MVETTGNYAKHRRVPYLLYDKENQKFKVIYVPALSGESLAHAYQVFLKEEAKAVYGEGIPVCEDCMKGEFFKSMDKKHLALKTGDKIPENVETIEELIIRKCLVEDIGGFLYAERPPIKRTSAFQVSYAVPIKDAALQSVAEPQLHARHAQLREIPKKETGVAPEQMLYYVETGSAFYGFTFNLDVDAIGISALTGKLILEEEEKIKRINTSIRALVRMISSRQFGAKLSRFFPVGRIVGVVTCLTQGPFAVTSPIYRAHAEFTAKRLQILRDRFEENVKMAIFDSIEDFSELESVDFIELSSTPEETLIWLLNEVSKE